MTVNKFYIFILMGLLTFTISCAQVEKADYQTPLHVPRDAKLPPLYFSGLKVELPQSEDIGVVSHKNRFCGLPYQPVGPDFLRGETTKTELQDIFENALEPVGYDIVSSPSSFFFEEEAENEVLRTEYKIGAKLIDLDMVACGQDSEIGFFGFQREGMKGELLATYEWSVFDNIRKTTVYKTTTQGYGKRSDVHRDGMSLLVYDSFEMASYNLASDPDFHNLIVNGFPVHSQKTQGNNIGLGYSDEEIVLLNLAKSSYLDLPKAKEAVVLIQAGMGHGSGFFITRDGHIITNAHVIGDAERVRVVTSNQKEKLAATVLRRDKVRDVALLRLENIPHHLKILSLPYKTKWPSVGEDVYVIGAPLNTRLQDTVTKGIISAHRKNFTIFGQTQHYLQADVAIQSGNSGGPMLDSTGNLVGIATAGTGLSNEALNYFIPIDEAFVALNIKK